jgi:hypothetical protein
MPKFIRRSGRADAAAERSVGVVQRLDREALLARVDSEGGAGTLR